MRKPSRKALAIGVGAALVAAGVAVAPTALAQIGPGISSENETIETFSDNLSNPYEEARLAAREDALLGVLSGKYTVQQNGSSTVVDLADGSAAQGGGQGGHGGGGSGGSGRGGGGHDGRGGHHGHGNNNKPKYVELGREAEDRIFTVLTEFGDLPSYAPDPAAQRTEGPLHNQIPAPNRSVDNSTVWYADFSQQYFNNLYFGAGESLKNYYEMQSSGRYSVSGTVTDWTFVPYSQRRYGTNNCGDNVCSQVKLLVRDSANQWYADQLAAGRSAADIAAQLATFDIWDRYDIDGDGNFNEPDGFLDHFQVVHAGGDEADGDPIYAGDAIWSHRWYSNLAYGPSCDNPDLLCLTGTQIGDSGFWIGDYTMQPENGGRSVFYHEYGHDLGLPDDYNVVSGGDNNNEHWTLMAQSRLGARNDKGIGERGGDLGAWNKLQLGWLDYELVNYNDHKTVKLGPQEYNSADPQALIVALPQKSVSTDVGAPFAGAGQWFSGHTDETTSVMTTTVTVPADNPTLTFKTRFDIEIDYDSAWVAVNGTPIVGTVGGVTTEVPNNQNGNPIGWDGYTLPGEWIDGVFDLSAYAGQTVDLSFTYFTDPYVGGNYIDLVDGVFLDNITLGATVIGDAESTTGWTVSPAGSWETVGSTATSMYPHYYIAGYRSYTSYDKYLETGPYFFGYANTKPDWVDHYSYQEGLLISYWDLSYADNDTFEHPGNGRNLYIDAHPQPMTQASGPGGYWRARIQVYDAPFGKDKTDKVTLHVNGQKFTFGGLNGVDTFDDTKKYWYAELPNHGVKLPAYGVKIRVLNDSGGKLTVKVN